VFRVAYTACNSRRTHAATVGEYLLQFIAIDFAESGIGRNATIIARVPTRVSFEDVSKLQECIRHDIRRRNSRTLIRGYLLQNSFLHCLTHRSPNKLRPATRMSYKEHSRGDIKGSNGRVPALEPRNAHRAYYSRVRDLSLCGILLYSPRNFR